MAYGARRAPAHPLPPSADSEDEATRRRRPGRRHPFAAFEQLAEDAPDRIREREAAKIVLKAGRNLTPGRRNSLADLLSACAVAGDRQARAQSLRETIRRDHPNRGLPWEVQLGRRAGWVERRCARPPASARLPYRFVAVATGAATIARSAPDARRPHPLAPRRRLAPARLHGKVVKRYLFRPYGFFRFNSFCRAALTIIPSRQRNRIVKKPSLCAMWRSGAKEHFSRFCGRPRRAVGAARHLAP